MQSPFPREDCHSPLLGKTPKHFNKFCLLAAGEKRRGEGSRGGFTSSGPGKAVWPVAAAATTAAQPQAPRQLLAGWATGGERARPQPICTEQSSDQARARKTEGSDGQNSSNGRMGEFWGRKLENEISDKRLCWSQWERSTQNECPPRARCQEATFQGRRGVCRGRWECSGLSLQVRWRAAVGHGSTVVET